MSIKKSIKYMLALSLGLAISLCITVGNNHINKIDHLTSNYELHKKDYINKLRIIDEQNIIDKQDIINTDTSEVIIDNSLLDTKKSDRYWINKVDGEVWEYFGQAMYLAASDKGKGNKGIDESKYLSDNKIIVDANFIDGIQVDNSYIRYAIALGESDIALCVPYSKVKLGITTREPKSNKIVDSYYLITALKVLSNSEISTGPIRRYEDNMYGNVLRTDNIGIPIIYGNTYKMNIIRYDNIETGSNIIYYKGKQITSSIKESTDILDEIKYDIFSAVLYHEDYVDQFDGLITFGEEELPWIYYDDTNSYNGYGHSIKCKTTDFRLKDRADKSEVPEADDRGVIH